MAPLVSARRAKQSSHNEATSTNSLLIMTSKSRRFTTVAPINIDHAMVHLVLHHGIAQEELDGAGDIIAFHEDLHQEGQHNHDHEWQRRAR